MTLSKALERHFSISIRNPLRLRDYHRRNARIPLIYGHHDGGPEFKRPEQLDTDKRKYCSAKVIFLVRDPRDVLVSSYFQKTRRNIHFHGSLDEYLAEPVGGLLTNIAFYNIWMTNRHVPAGFLLVSYEEMRADPAAVVRGAFDFIGLGEIDERTIDQAVAYCAFEHMKRREEIGIYGAKSLSARDPSDETTFKLRQGNIGGYKEHFSARQQAYIDRLIDSELDSQLERYRSPQR